MSVKSKRSVFTILTVVLLGVLVLAGSLISRNEQSVGDIRVFMGGSDKLYVVPFTSGGEGEGDEYSSGDALLSYVAGEKHRLEVIRRGKTVSRDMVFIMETISLWYLSVWKMVLSKRCLQIPCIWIRSLRTLR